MRKRVAPNPYMDRSLGRLYEACQARAGELLDPPPGPRTAEQRRALALDTAHLLMAVAARVHVSEHVPGSPEQAMANAPSRLAKVYGEYFEHLAARARYATLMRACNYVHGDRAERWRQETTLDGLPVTQLAMASDEGLRRVLEHLEEISHEGSPSGRRPGRPASP